MDKQNMHYFPTLDEKALGRALGDWKSDFPDMGVLALVPEAEKDSVGRLQAIFSRLAVPLVGAVFPALIADGEFRSSGVWLLRFDRMPYFALHDALPDDTAGAAEVADRIAEGVRSQLDDTTDVTLFMLFDALVPNIGTVLDELYLRLANRVHYLGANAGSETFQPMPCLFDGERIVGKGVLVMLLQPHCGGILEHGYSAPDQMIYATSTVGNRILHIDWRPAFEVYRELIKEQYGVEVTRENFYVNAVHFPFGIIRANHSILVRIPVALGEDDSLFCVGEVPPNSVLTLLEAPAVDSTHALEALRHGLSGLYGDVAGHELLLFFCAGRHLHLGHDAATRELHELLGSTRVARIAGARSLGEIGPSTIGGYPLFHNATLVATCL
jgi:hypothetical protein